MLYNFHYTFLRFIKNNRAIDANIINKIETSCATGIPYIFNTLSTLKCSTKILANEYKIKYKQANVPGHFENFLKNTSSTIKIKISNMLSYKKVG